MKGIADLIRSGKSVGFRRFGLIDKPEVGLQLACMIYVVRHVAVLCPFMKEILGFWPLSQHSPLSLLSFFGSVYTLVRRVFRKE